MRVVAQVEATLLAFSGPPAGGREGRQQVQHLDPGLVQGEQQAGRSQIAPLAVLPRGDARHEIGLGLQSAGDGDDQQIDPALGQRLRVADHHGQGMVLAPEVEGADGAIGIPLVRGVLPAEELQLVPGDRQVLLVEPAPPRRLLEERLRRPHELLAPPGGLQQLDPLLQGLPVPGQALAASPLTGRARALLPTGGSGKEERERRAGAEGGPGAVGAHVEMPRSSAGRRLRCSAGSRSRRADRRPSGPSRRSARGRGAARRPPARGGGAVPPRRRPAAWGGPPR